MRLLVALFGVLLIAGCGTEREDNAQTTRQSASAERPPQPTPNPPRTESREMIPDVDIIPEGVSLRPFFDEAGTVTELAASVGDEVNIFIYIETPEPIRASACAFRMVIPAAVDLMRERKFADGTLSIGNWDTNYSLAWPCRPVGRFWVVHYVFTVTDSFSGGEFTTTDGFAENATMFIGLGTCHGNSGDTMRSAGGTITLTAK